MKKCAFTSLMLSAILPALLNAGPAYTPPTPAPKKEDKKTDNSKDPKKRQSLSIPVARPVPRGEIIYSAGSSAAKIHLPAPTQDNYYMTRVYPVVKEQSPDTRKSVNNYLISLETKKAAIGNLGPQIDFSASIGKNFTRGDTTAEGDFLQSGFSFFQPLFSLGRYYDYVRSKQGIHVADFQQKLREQQFIQVFASALIRISVTKTGYYFAKEQYAFLKSYFEKTVKDTKKAFLATVPAPTEEFEIENFPNLADLQEEMNRQARSIADSLTLFQNEVNNFRVNILNARNYPFERKDNLADLMANFPVQDVNLNAPYNPDILNKFPLPKYSLVHPFIERKIQYPDSQESDQYAFAGKPATATDSGHPSNLNIMIAKVVINEAETALKAGKAAFWPEIGLTASYGGDWEQQRSPGTEASTIFNGFVGLSFRMNIWDGGVRRAQVQINKLQLDNAKLDLENVERGLATGIAIAHRNISTSVQKINHLLISYKKTKEVMKRNLEANNANNLETATILQKIKLVNNHFAAAKDLAIEQHTYLSNTLDLLAYRNELDPAMLAELEAKYFIDCTNYDKFLGLSGIVIH